MTRDSDVSAETVPSVQIPQWPSGPGSRVLLSAAPVDIGFKFVLLSTDDTVGSN